MLKRRITTQKRLVTCALATILSSNFLNSSIKVMALGNFDISSPVISRPINLEQSTIAPGITQKIYTFENNDHKRVKAFVVEADLKNPNVGVEAGTPKNSPEYGLSTVKEQANAASNKLEKVVAAVNADFFNMGTGEPLGTVYKDGTSIKDDFGPDWRFFGIKKDGTAVIGDHATFEQVKNELDEALGGHSILVKDGQVFETKPAGQYREPRTAVGIKSDGKILFVTIDGRQDPYSAGMGMDELAQFMISLGAVQALNLDGGGSSTYLSRTPGQDNLDLQNKPSDGNERVVANSWQVVSKTPSDNVFSSANITPSDKTYTPNSTIQFSAVGRDASGGSAPLPKDGLSWHISDDSFGSIDSNGLFTSNGKTGQFEVLIKQNNNIVGRCFSEIAVPNELSFSSPNITLARNSEKDLGLIARFDGRDVKWKLDDFDFIIPDGMGTIDENGILHSGNTIVSGKITAKLKGTSYETSIDVTVGQLPNVLNDFENGVNNWKTTVVGRGEIGSIGTSTYPDEPTRFGDHSLKINYDFTNAQRETTLGVYAGIGEDVTIPGSPSSIGMWIFADESTQGYWLRMGLLDGAGKAQNINLTPESGVNWTGWKYIEASIPSNFVGPFKFNPNQTIRIMTQRSGITGPMTKGSLYVDNIRAVYGEKVDDLYAPVIDSINVDGKTFNNNQVGITAKLHEYDDDQYKTGINWDRVRVLVDGKDYTGTPKHFSYDMDGTVSLAGYKWANGIHKVEIIAQDKFGNESNKTAYFTVNSNDTKIELSSSKEDVYLGETHEIKLKASDLSNISSIKSQIKLPKEFKPSDVHFSDKASSSTYSYNEDTGILDLNITVTDNTQSAEDLATILVPISQNLKKGSKLEYSILNSEVTYVHLADDNYIGSFTSIPFTSPIKEAFTLTPENLLVGEEGILKVTDSDGNPSSGVEVHSINANNDDTILGVTDSNGYLKTNELTDTVKKLSLYATKDGLYSFKLETQSFKALKELTPSNVFLSSNIDPQTQQSISWMSTPFNDNKQAVVMYSEKSEYDKNGDNSLIKFDGTFKNKVFNGESNLQNNGIIRINSATLESLKPNTTYVFKVGDGTNFSDIDEFTTQSNKESFDFTILGDTQSPNDLSKFDAFLKEINENPLNEFNIHVGDFIDESSKFNQWDKMINEIHKYENVDSQDFVSVLGNHEYMGDLSGEIAKSIFNTPKNGPNEDLGGTYSTNYNNLHISVLSYTNDEKVLDAQLEWLKQDVKNSDKLWNIVVTHQPPYYTNPLGGNELMRKKLPPVVEELGIDLVLSGHDHAYGRTKPLINGNEDKDGTVYVVTGTTGEKHYDALSDEHFAVINTENIGVYLSAHIENGKFNIKVKSSDGKVVDDFTLEKDNKDTSNQNGNGANTTDGGNSNQNGNALNTTDGGNSNQNGNAQNTTDGGNSNQNGNAQNTTDGGASNQNGNAQNTTDGGASNQNGNGQNTTDGGDSNQNGNGQNTTDSGASNQSTAEKSNINKGILTFSGSEFDNYLDNSNFKNNIPIANSLSLKDGTESENTNTESTLAQNSTENENVQPTPAIDAKDADTNDQETDTDTNDNTTVLSPFYKKPIFIVSLISILGAALAYFIKKKK